MAASGLVSLLLASSLLLLFPVGLFIAPFGLIPVVQQLAAGRRASLAWGWITAGLVVLAVSDATFLGLPVWTFLAAYGAVVVVPAASLELWLAIGGSEGRWATLTTLSGTVLAVLAVTVAARPASPYDALAAWWGDATASMVASYRALGIASGELELALDSIQTIVPWILPGLPVVLLLVITLFWIRPRLPMLGLPLRVAPFEAFRVDEWLPLGFALGGGGAVLFGGTARWLAINLLVAVLALYFVQGLAMIRAHLARWIGRGLLVRWVLALLCLQGPLPFLVAALGMADGFYSLRPRTGDNGGEE
jgi:hypothetical protein